MLKNFSLFKKKKSSQQLKNSSKEKLQQTIAELERIVKLLVRKDFELRQVRERQEKKLLELDKITKLLVKRDFELSQTKAWLTEALEESDRIRVELEKERNKIKAIIDSLVDGLVVLDEQRKIDYLNPQAELLFGVKSENFKGKTIEQVLKHPILGQLIRLIQSEKKESAIRKELALDKPEEKVLQVSTAPIVGQSGSILGLIIVLHDISREKLIERMKTEFVSITAHQLRTPLSSIKWVLKMLLEGDLGPVTKEQTEVLEQAYTSNERMISLINDLLNVARLEEGRFLYKFSRVSLVDLIKKSIDSLNMEAKKREIQLIFEKPKKTLPKIIADAEKLQLVIQNLLDNAIRYTHPKGKVTVTLRQPKKNYLEVAVKDTGVGIPKNQQSRIFDKFFRADNVIKMQTEGSGLGLFISKNIVEKHGGKIWFESEENKGTTFYFTLPLNRE